MGGPTTLADLLRENLKDITPLRVTRSSETGSPQ